MPNQILIITNHHHLGKQIFNLTRMTTHKVRNGREVRHAITRQRLKNDIGFTTPLNLSATGNAL